MNRRTKIAIAGIVTGAAIAGGAAAAVAGGGDDAPLTGDARDRAVSAALAHVGEGTVTETETETGDGGAVYTVEVALEDGTHVEVQLDERFWVTGTETDDDGPGDEDAGTDDD